MSRPFQARPGPVANAHGEKFLEEVYVMQDAKTVRAVAMRRRTSMPVQVFLLIHQPVLMPFLSCKSRAAHNPEEMAGVRRKTSEDRDRVASFL